MSQICPSCLTELGRIRALPDPHYGLPVVACPGCMRATVRVKHPDRAYWRQMRHLRKSIQQLLLALIFTSLSVGAIIGMSAWVSDEITTRSARYITPDLINPGVVSQLMVACLVVLMCGCIARSLLAHRRFLTVLAVFAVLTLLFACIDAVFSWAVFVVQVIVNTDLGIELPSTRSLQRRGLALLPALPLFVAGMGVGTLLNKLIARSDQKRIVRIRRRLRRRQSRQD